MRWKTERSFDDKLCQKYLCQKLLKFDNGSQDTVENVGDVFWDTVYKVHCTVK